MIPLDGRVGYEFPIVRDALQPQQERFVADLWSIFHNDDEDKAKRFRAGMALALYEPDDSKWVGTDQSFLVNQLLATNIDEQRELRNCLRPAAEKILPVLVRTYAESEASDLARLKIGVAWVEYFPVNPIIVLQSAFATQNLPSDVREVLNELIDSQLKSTAFPDQTAPYLREIVRRAPSDELSGQARVDLARNRGTAALGLIQLDEPQAAMDLLPFDEDPDAASQVSRLIASKYVPPADLLTWLRAAGDPQIRDGLLLAMGDLPLNAFAEAEDQLRADLLDWHRDNPRASTHSACEWLLRTWGLGDEMAANIADGRPLDPTGERDWFVERIGADVVSLVVFQPDSFRFADSHDVELTRPFAVSTTEVTQDQFERFLRATSVLKVDKYRQANKDSGNAGPNRPALYVSWHACIKYCNWLTEMAGMAESDQVYSNVNYDPEVGPPAMTYQYHPERRGFRLLTDAEWEYACRAGTTTRCYFGSDAELFPRYAWLVSNSAATCRPVGMLRPNPKGLFDMYGNAYEWVYDRYLRDPEVVPVDPTGPAEGPPQRTLRGGSFASTGDHLRSAQRSNGAEHDLAHILGFRIGRTVELDE